MIISVLRHGELYRWIANVGTSYDVGVAPTRDMAWDAAWDVATRMMERMKKAA